MRELRCGGSRPCFHCRSVNGGNNNNLVSNRTGQVQQPHRNEYVHRSNHVGQDNSGKRGKCNKRNDRHDERSDCNRSDSSHHTSHRQPLHPRGVTATVATPQANARSGTEGTTAADLLHVKSCRRALSGINGISPDVRMHTTDGENIVGVRANMLAKLKQLVTLTLVVAFAVAHQQLRLWRTTGGGGGGVSCGGLLRRNLWWR